MKIEFIGLPGVGKTTILDRINILLNEQEQYEQHTQKKSCYLNSIIFTVRFFILYPGSLRLMFTSFRWLVIKLSFRNCLNLTRLDKKNNFFFSKTNGMLMPIITYIAQRNPDNIVFDISKLLDTLTLPDILIVVTADIDTIVRRYAKRGGLTLPDRISRESVIVNKNLYDSFKRGGDMVDKIANLLQKKGVKILRVNSSERVTEETLRCIIKEIKND